MTAPAPERHPVEELAEEFLERYRRGERPTPTEYARRYPELAEEIRDLFPTLAVMEEAGPNSSSHGGRCRDAMAPDGKRLEHLGDYRILAEVGRGGMGIVYEAEQVSLGRHVALKVLPFQASVDILRLNRFRREARAAARLHHTNIVPVFDVGEFEGTHYYTMQFIRGQGLDQVLEEVRRLRGARGGQTGESSLQQRRQTRLSANLAGALVSGVFHPSQEESPAMAPAEPAAVPHSPQSPVRPDEAVERDSAPAGHDVLVAESEPVVATTSLSDLSASTDSHYYRSVARIGIQVAEALAYAHAHNVLHRDIKPSNLLLDLQGIVWVTDFGLAKEEGTDLTGSGDLVGTLRYLAPERLNGRSDPRGDIYGLGLTLYELLTFRSAFTETDRRRLMQQVAQVEPPPPRKLEPRVPRDLETIVLKAMAKEPARRYQSAEHLAEDLRRFLGDRPILARRAAAWEQGWRWCRRNPAIAGLATLVALLILGLATGAVLHSIGLNEQLKRAERAEQAERAAREDALEKLQESNRSRGEAVQAREAEAEQRQLAQTALEREKQANQAAQERETETQAVLDFVLNKVFAVARPQGQGGGLGREVTLRRAIDAALPFVGRSFSGQPLIEARLRMTLGRSFLYLGNLKMAAEQFHRARTVYAQYRGPDHLDTLRSMNDLANCYTTLGRYAEACDLHEETLRIRKAKFGPDHPETLHSMNNLAICFYGLGRHADALRLREETLALRKARLGPDHPDTLYTMDNLASSYFALGRRAEALQLYEQTLALRKVKLGSDHPDTLESMNNLANCYYNLGRYAEALKLHEEALAIRKAKLGPNHPDTLHSMNNLANNYEALGRHAEGLKLRQETLTLRTIHLGPDHPDTLTSMNNLAVGYATLGRYGEARKLHEETLAIRKAKLGLDHPDTLQSMANLAECLDHLDRGTEALSVLDEYIRRATGQVIDPHLLNRVIELRLRHFERAKDAAGCRATAEMYEKLKGEDAESLYDAACFRAVTAAVIQAGSRKDSNAHEAAAEVARAMIWLKQAVAAGYSDAANMVNDKDLDTMRDREDFKKLLAELKAKAEPKAK